ncbi:hypothetical protein [Caenibius sp. WL]|uniref:hypothetical protein n=1 Tax=Caenibius sp. WL TaxID=2872646 RepID=UPI001C99ECC4|nr:hypothetical protein [Caenibius sp. WL]QZP06696.1 hypothetical protein K5X80_08105 [Caenibius sp. WL]
MLHHRLRATAMWKDDPMQTRNELSRCLQHVHDEVLMALDAPTSREEWRHRRQADKYLSKAIRMIGRERAADAEPKAH